MSDHPNLTQTLNESIARLDALDSAIMGSDISDNLQYGMLLNLREILEDLEGVRDELKRD